MPRHKSEGLTLGNKAVVGDETMIYNIVPDLSQAANKQRVSISNSK